MRGAPWPGCRRGAAGLVPRAGQPRRRPLPAAEPQVARAGAQRAQGPRGPRATAGQRPLAHAAQAGREGRRHARGQALPRRAAGEHPLLHREERAPARALAARGGAHRAQGGAVLLPAAADPGHERGLGHLLASQAAEHDVRRRLPDRRRDDRVAEVAHQRGLPAAGRRARLQRPESLCAGLCDVHRHQAHLRCAHRRRPRLVPRSCRHALAACAAPRDAQLQGRELHRPVPVAQADARDASVRGRRRRERRRARSQRDPRRCRLPPRARGAGAPVRPGLARAQHPGLERQPARRPRADLAPHAAQQPAAGRRCAGGAQARGAAVGLSGAPGKHRRRRRCDATLGRRDACRRSDAASAPRGAALNPSR